MVKYFIKWADSANKWLQFENRRNGSIYRLERWCNKRDINKVDLNSTIVYSSEVDKCKVKGRDKWLFFSTKIENLENKCDSNRL